MWGCATPYPIIYVVYYSKVKAFFFYLASVTDFSGFTHLDVVDRYFFDVHKKQFGEFASAFCFVLPTEVVVF
jgi:hypothetical protein